MSKIKSTSTIFVNIVLALTEEEARALNALTLYGTPQFLDFFYKSLGKSYLQPHESGVYSLFTTIKEELPQHLNKADEARKALKKP